MPRPPHERVLVIGDADRHVQAAVHDVLPAAQVVSVGSVFDGIAELTAGPFSTVLAAAEPIERRPEAAVRTLRELTGPGRLVLFGHPTLEPLSRKMLDFGVDDYLITPAQPNELKQVFGTAPMRLAPADVEGSPVDAALDADLADAGRAEPGADDARARDDALGLDDAPPAARPSPFAGVPLADAVLDALLQSPHDPVAGAVRHVNAALGIAAQLRHAKADAPPPEAVPGCVVHSHPFRPAVTPALSPSASASTTPTPASQGPPASSPQASTTLHLVVAEDVDPADARHFLSQVAHQLGKLAALQERHLQLQKMAITDDLTGVHNGRYFRHFLAKILEKARTMRFPVTLLLFDIDNFKKYNDQYGHTVGDEILKQTAALMRRTVREHDCVARISGDEFAVVFWEKEGPRTPHHGVGVPGRPPHTPLQVFERFRKLLSSAEFTGLGASGQGVLTISAGLAVYPYDAQTPDALYAAADRALMFGSKKAGKNAVYLVGGDDPVRATDDQPPSQARGD